MGAYNHYAAGLPDPARAAQQHRLRAADGHLRPDRQDRARPARRPQARARHLRATCRARSSTRRPPSRTRTSGSTRASIPRASCRPDSTRSRASRAARRRSPSSSSARASCRPRRSRARIYERKMREIIQSIRLTQAFPGEEGKQQIITAYLNQNFYGNQSYGVKAAAKSYFGKSLADLTLAQDAILAAIPQSPTKFDLMRNADRGLPRGRRRGRGMHEVQARRPGRLGDRPAPEQGPRPDEDAQPADRQQAHRRPSTRSPRRSRSSSAAGRRRVERAALRLAGAARARRRCSARRIPIDCPEVDTGGYKVITTLDWKMQKTAEKWVYVAARAPNAKNPSAILSSRKIPRSARSWILGLRGHNIHNAAAGGRSTTGPARSSPTSGRRATRPRATRSSSRSSTSSPTAGGSPVRRSSRSTTRSASTTRR